jgi:hypothetical protein
MKLGGGQGAVFRVVLTSVAHHTEQVSEPNRNQEMLCPLDDGYTWEDDLSLFSGK